MKKHKKFGRDARMEGKQGGSRELIFAAIRADFGQEPDMKARCVNFYRTATCSGKSNEKPRCEAEYLPMVMHWLCHCAEKPDRRNAEITAF